MKLQGTGMPQSAFVSPFESMIMKPYNQTVGAGIGVKRTEPGFRAERADDTEDVGEAYDSPFASTQVIPGATSPRPGGTTERTKRIGNQALGETPPRDGPFQSAASGVAKEKPTRAVKKKSAVNQRRKDGAGVVLRGK